MKQRYHAWTKTAVKWPNRIHVRIDAYPLMGVTFTLLLMFMIGTAVTPHHDWSPDLPSSRYASPMPGAVRERAQIVSVMNDGTLYYGNTRIAVVELHSRIGENLKNGADRKIYIRADARVKYGRVKEVLNEIGTSEIQNVCFLAQKVSP